MKNRLNSWFVCVYVVLITFQLEAIDLNKFNKEVKPLLKKYCITCHGPEKEKADLRMDLLDPDMINGQDAGMWQEALDLVNVGEMPTKKSEHHPSREERSVMVDWMTEALNTAMLAKRSSGGRVVTRRLTNYEYQNTLRDLFGLDLPYAKDLPPEGVAKHGFKNNYKTLITSDLHLEYYERIARQTLEKIILIPESQPEAYEFHAEVENISESKKGKKKSKGSNNNKTLQARVNDKVSVKASFVERLESKGVLLTGNRKIDALKNVFETDKKIGGSKGLGRDGYQPNLSFEMGAFPGQAPIRIRIKAAGIKGRNGQSPKLSCELGSFRGAGYSQQKEVANVLVEAGMDEPQIYEFIVQGESFPIIPNKTSRPTYFRIFNDSRRGTTKLDYADLPKLFIDWVEIKAHHYESWPPKTKEEILFPSQNSKNDLVYASEVLEKFMSKAYRRPVSKDEVNLKVELFKELWLKQKNFESAIIPTLASVLYSPKFLFICEPAGDLKNKRKLNDYELATRLSYFLWSSCPDDQLYQLAERKILSQPDTLSSEISRMLKDEKSLGLVRNFTQQWLNLDTIEQIAVNPAVFSDFRLRDKALFERESVEFFRYILNQNLSVLNFIDSDFVVINHQLAKHYRIPDISTAGFQKVKLDKSQQRGGFLTQASILFGNSTGADTHPVKRGTWLLEKILNDPPPPPPPSAPELPEEDASVKKHRSLKERLADHAKVESCYDCHSKIDPWGVAFENYNALGQWREGELDTNVSLHYQKVSVDASTTLKNGTKIKDLKDLKNYLLKHKKEQYIKALVTKMISYSTGRYTEFTDQLEIDRIADHLKKDQYKLHSLIEHIIFSEAFQTK